MLSVLYSLIAIILLAVLAVMLFWRNARLRRSLAQSEAHRQELARGREAQRRDRNALREKDAALNARTEELRRMREALHDWQLDYRDLEDDRDRIQDALAEETAHRLAAEKESGLKNMKLERLERELDESLQLLRTREGQARQSEASLQDIIQEQAEEIARLQEAQQSPAFRRPRRARAEQAEGQITVEEILTRR